MTSPAWRHLVGILSSWFKLITRHNFRAQVRLKAVTCREFVIRVPKKHPNLNGDSQEWLTLHPRHLCRSAFQASTERLDLIQQPLQQSVPDRRLAPQLPGGRRMLGAASAGRPSRGHSILTRGSRRDRAEAVRQARTSRMVRTLLARSARTPPCAAIANPRTSMLRPSSRRGLANPVRFSGFPRVDTSQDAGSA